MTRVILLFVVSALATCGRNTVTNDKPSPKEIEQSFLNPPASAKPHVWWHWMNGNISKEGITADLEAMADIGIGGAQIFNEFEGIPHGKIRFNSPEWIDMVVHASMEAERLGLELGIHNCGGWANSGGPWNTPENSAKFVITDELQVKGPAKFSKEKAISGFYPNIAVLAFRTPKEVYAIKNLNGKIFRDRMKIKREEPVTVSPDAILNPDDVIDISDKVLAEDGAPAEWDVPEGDWTIVRIGYVSNGRINNAAPEEGTGLEVDKLSREAIKIHWDAHMGRILAATGPRNGKTGLNNVLIDSYEVGSQNWTSGFEKEFEKRTGYSIAKFLPVLAGRIVESPEITERFLWDYRRVIANMFAENYSGYFSEMAHEANLLYYIEPYGDCPSDDIQFGSYADVPMGEFWSAEGHSLGVSNTKMPSSIGHIYGRRFIGAEAFTSEPEASMWTKGPFEHKAQGDAVYCNGINRLIYQHYAHQPWTNPVRYPGMTMGQFGTNFEHTLTWWKQGKDWLNYQARCQYMLQEGRFFADVLYFSGEGAPNDGGAATVYYPDKAEDLRNSTGLPLGYDYDACDTRALSLLKVVDGNLTLPSGMTYRLLVLPDEGAFTPETLKEILRLAEAGATIVGGEKPQQSPGLKGYPTCDEKVRKLSDRIWSKIISGQRLDDVLASLKLQPDFQAPERSGLGYIHRLLSGMDVYFVACPSLSGDDADCTFRISGMKPEFWNPETGVISDVPLYTESNGLTTIPIHFDPAGSVFVVFRKYTQNEHITSIKQTSTGTPHNKKPVTIPVPAYELKTSVTGETELFVWEPSSFKISTSSGKTLNINKENVPEPVEITGPWKLSFPSGWGAPEEVTLDKLISWTKHPDNGVKYFSGTATYDKTFVRNSKPDVSSRLILDLGYLKNFAEIEVNGKTFPVLWKPPYRVDITDIVKAGDNTLKVKITNYWPNRLIGDEQLPADCEWEVMPFRKGMRLKNWPQWVLEDKPSPTGRYTFTTWLYWRKDSKPLPSGLFGPVLLREIKEVKIL